MKKVYHILLIDNEESQLNLIETELTKLNIQVQIDTIYKKEQLIDRLENNPPDLVISDYNMPTLTGTDALRIVQDRHPELPFILVADSVGEEKAIDIMLQGASDYVLNQNLVRLGPAIRRELAKYENHKKQSWQLERTNSNYKKLLKSINGIVWEADVETLEFLYVSPQSKQLLGYSPQEWLGDPKFWQEHIHPDDRKEVIHFCHHKTQQGENHEFEYRMLGADGDVVWLRDYVSVITKKGKPNRLCGFMVDISGEKNAERQRDKAYEIANIGHWELDLVNEELYWSNAVKNIHEVEPDYEPDLKTALEFYKEGKHRQIITTAVENAVETGESFEVELIIITSNGNEKWVRAVGETELRKGECVRIYGSTQDITERKISEKKYRDIFNLSPQPMWVHDPKTLKFLDVNRAVLNHYGFSYEEFMQMTLKDIRPEEDIPDLMKAVKETRSKKVGYYEGQFRHKTKDESIIYVNIKRKTIDYEGQKAAIVLAEDVTEKLEIERELQLSEQKFKSLVESGASMIAVLNEEGIFTYVSKNCKQFVGWCSEELMGKNAFELTHSDDKDRVQTLFHKLQIEKENQHSLPYRFKHKDGKWIWIESIASDLSHSSVLNGYVINSYDVTEQVERQKELRESLERYETVSKATSNTIWELDLETKTINYNPNIYNVFGYEHQQVDEVEDWWRSKIHPDDQPEVLRTIEIALRSSSERFQMEYRFQAADGTYRFINDRAFIVEDQEGNPIRVIGAMRDVSDQKEAQRKIEKAFQERERILDRINEAFFATDQNWNVTYWNKKAEEVIGVKRDDILGEHFWETFPVAKEHKFFKEYNRALREQVSVQFEEYYPPLKKWFEVTAYPSEEGLSVFFRDVTERREAEQSLQELYEKNRLVLESTDEGIYGIDTKGRCTFINKAAADMLGYRSEDCLGMNMHKLIHHKYSNGEQYPESECPIFISISKHDSCRVMDEVFWKADGTCFEVEYTSNPMIEDGEIKGGVVAFSDITMRKKQEHELRESLEEKETLLMEIHHRVKNNLAVVSGMMQLQAYEEEDENVQQKLDDAINRIKTMGGIHELLYQSKSFSRIDADRNIRKLVTDIVETFQNSVELDVKFDLQKISLNINQAIPLSLIINEVITNAMKHAFVDRNQGILSVSLAEEDDVISIQIMDNGKGLPDNFKTISNSNSLGLQLIDTLSAQLEGEYTYESPDEGTLFTFTFEKSGVKGIGNAHLS